MHNSDLLIAQLQRRNRIMFGGMLAGLAVIAIGFGLVMLDATTELPPAPQTDTKPSAAPTKNAPSTWHLLAVNRLLAKARLIWLTQLPRLN